MHISLWTNFSITQAQNLDFEDILKKLGVENGGEQIIPPEVATVSEKPIRIIVLPIDFDLNSRKKGHSKRFWWRKKRF